MSMTPNPSPDGPLPLLLAAEQPAERNRLTAALRLIWVIPQFFVLFFVFVAAFFVLIIGWFGALFTGRLPDFAAEFLTGAIRWGTRVSGYLMFLTDEYPPFSLQEDPAYPVKMAFPQGARLNQMAVLGRIFLVIPASIVSSVLGSGVVALAIASWATITFTGTQPIPLYEAIRVVTRYQLRVSGYFCMLTAEYPWGPLGDVTADKVPATSEPDTAWRLELSPGGRTAMIVVIVLGVISEFVNNNYRG